MAGPTSSSDRRRQRWVFGVLVLLVVVSCAGRVIPGWSLVAHEDGPRLLGIDPYYHLRHTLYSVQHFPEVQRWDVGTHYPRGERAEHPGLFNVLCAGAALLAGLGSPSESLVTWVVAWSPVALHALALVFLFLAARTLLGGGLALVVVALYAAYPGLSLPRTVIGFSDHHALEILLLLASVWGVLRLGAERPDRASDGGAQGGHADTRRGGTQRRIRALRSLALATPLVLFNFSWAGAPLALLLIGGAILVVVAANWVRGGNPSAYARAGIWVGSSVGGAVLLAWLLAPNAIMKPKLVVPILILAAGISGASAAARHFGRRLQMRFTGLQRAGLLAGLVGGGAVAAMALLPAQYFELLADQKTLLVREHRVIGAAEFWRLFGIAGVLAALAPLLIWRQHGRRAAGSAFDAGLFCLVFGFALLAIWLRSHDYGYAVGPFVALLAGLSLENLGWQAAWPRRAANALAPPPNSNDPSPTEAEPAPAPVQAPEQRAPAPRSKRGRRGKAGSRGKHGSGKPRLSSRAAASGASAPKAKQRRPDPSKPGPNKPGPNKPGPNKIAARSRLLLASFAVAAIVQIWPAEAAFNPLTYRPQGMVQINDGWSQAMDWLRSNTPEPVPAVDAKVASWDGNKPRPFGEGSYGVMGAWDFGNFVSALGKRTPVFSHGIDRGVSQWLVSPDEATSLARLCRRCEGEQRVRYAALSAATLGEHFLAKVELSGRSINEFRGTLGKMRAAGGRVNLRTFGDAYDQTIAARLYVSDANGLGHYRLIYESPHHSMIRYRGEIRQGTSGPKLGISLETLPIDGPLPRVTFKAVQSGGQHLYYGQRVLSTVKIFEVVTGAKLVGITQPGATVEVRLELAITTTGRTLSYGQVTTAGADGHFELTVPYSSEGASNVVRATSSLRLQATRDGVNSEERSVEVSEEAVQGAARLDVGNLEF